MTKDVIVSVKGIQSDLTNKDSIEMITTGSYYYKNNKHYVKFEDNDLDCDRKTQTTVKIKDDKIEVIRFGGANAHMVFEEGIKNQTHYDTPFGPFVIGIDTKKVKIEEKEDLLQIEADYTIDINHEHIGENSLNLKIQSNNTLLEI